MILSILISACGFFSAKRMFEPIFFIFETSDQRQIGIWFLFLSGHWIGFIFFSNKPVLLWIFQLALVIFSFLYTRMIKSNYVKSAQDKVLMMIDETCLGLTSGQSLRTSLMMSVGREQRGMGLQIKNMVLSLSELDMKDRLRLPFLVEIRSELLRIESSSKNILDQLRVLRQSLRTEIYFRHKSGQVLKNIRIQAGSIFILYILMSLFVSTQINLWQYPRLVLSSLFLLVLGLGSIFSIGGRVKWKV